MKKKPIKKKVVKSAESLDEHFHNFWTSQNTVRGLLGQPLKKLTKKQTERQKKWAREERARQKKEEKRRAKPMKITVGEYEDAIEEAKEYYRYDY